MDIKQNYNLANLTTFQIGGQALFFAEVGSEDEVNEACVFAEKSNLPILVLGRGSNILVSDKGFQGLVLLNKILFFQATEEAQSVLLELGAGENWDDVVGKTVERGWSGIESLSGIPGTVGGAVVQSIGAYGQSIMDVIEWVRVFDLSKAEYVIFQNKDCGFAYRDSLFKREQGRFVVSKVCLRLEKSKTGKIIYKDLKNRFEGKGEMPLSSVRSAVISIRVSKGYVIMPQYESYKTAGSYFKNPVIGREIFASIKDNLSEPDDTEVTRWYWEQEDGVKVAAARLLQKAGFGKGYTEGKVGISPKHALSLINLEDAKAVDVYDLAQKIKKSVFDKFGIMLAEEILYIGEF